MDAVTVSLRYAYGGASAEEPLVSGVATGGGPDEQFARVAASDDLYRQCMQQHSVAADAFEASGFRDPDALTRAMAALIYIHRTVLSVPSILHAPVRRAASRVLGWRSDMRFTLGPEAISTLSECVQPVLADMLRMEAVMANPGATEDDLPLLTAHGPDDDGGGGDGGDGGDDDGDW